MKIEEAVENYQCSGCTNGCDISCYEKSESRDVSCSKHSVGTFVGCIGRVQLGLPKGFDRVGSPTGNTKIVDFYMYQTYQDQQEDFGFDNFNIPVWKYLYNGCTLVRGVSPRTNKLFIHCILEDCLDKIECLELTTEQINAMD